MARATRLTKVRVNEISLCGTPANPHARVVVAKVEDPGWSEYLVRESILRYTASRYGGNPTALVTATQQALIGKMQD